MNFFGHAVVATWRSSNAGFVLGAMVPDFATMLGVKPPVARHPEVTAGIDFHHATDKVFHDAPTFQRLQLEARRALRELGLPRPSALGVAHIGVEILLDGTLASDERGVAGYLGALASGGLDGFGGALDWEPEVAGRYAMIVATLDARGVSKSAATPEAVALRVERALSNRPRLRLPEGGDVLVRKWADLAAPDVQRASAQLIDELRAGLPHA